MTIATDQTNPLKNNRWQKSYRADPALARLFDRHYSRVKVGSRQFHPPGQAIELYIPGPLWPFQVEAGWVWWRPHPEKANRYDGYDGWTCCSAFRNESSHLSSSLILEAVQVHLDLWGPPEHGFDTYIWPEKLRSTNPGYCYLVAGWHKGGWTKDGRKRRIYLPIEEVPPTA